MCERPVGKCRDHARVEVEADDTHSGARSAVGER